MNSENQEYKPHQEQYAIALPCEPNEFSKFISELLGKPQTIIKTYSGSFEISHKDIENAYHLVSQRVTQQNDSNLIQFTVQLVFDDNSSVLLNSFDDFSTYSEVRPVVVRQAHLSWSFLVQFNDRSHPEKQEIELSFMTQGARGEMVFDENDSPIDPITHYLGGGFVSFHIKHSARTWGADIESLLSGHIKHILLPESKVRSFIRKHSGKIATTFGTTFFVASLTACFYSASKAEKTRLEVLKPIVNNNDLDMKLNTLLDMVASGYWGTFFFSVFVFAIFSLIAAIILAAWAASSANTRQPSHILLTKKSEQHKKKSDKQYRSKFLYFVASIATGVITGVISNIIFTVYWIGSP